MLHVCLWVCVLTTMSMKDKNPAVHHHSQPCDGVQGFLLHSPELFLSLLLWFPPLSRDQKDFPHSSTTAVWHRVYLHAVSMWVFAWYCVYMFVGVCIRGTLKVMIRCVKWNSASRSSWMVTFSTPAGEGKHTGNELLKLYVFLSIHKSSVFKMSTDPRWALSHTLTMLNIYRLFVFVQQGQLALWQRLHTKLINLKFGSGLCCTIT